MKTAIELMTAHCNGTPADVREYVELLKQDSPESFDRLGQLMVKLQKSLSDVQADKALLSRVAELRGQIGAARGISGRVKQLEDNVAANARSVSEARLKEEQQLRGSSQALAAAMSTLNAGEDAVVELNKLREEYHELLRDEPAARPEELVT